MIFLLQGCASVPIEPERPELENVQVKAPGKLKKDLTNLSHVTLGMTVDEVYNIMGDAVVIGYRQSPEDGSLQPVEMTLPNRFEELDVDGKSYKVVYYYSHPLKADGIVADDELVPLIFLNNRLISKDKNFLFDLKK